MEEVILVEIAHYEPIIFKLLAEGIFPAINISLPRPENLRFTELYENLKSKYAYNRSVDISTIIDTSKADSKIGKAPKIDPIVLEAESEADRIIACEELKKSIDEFYLKAG